MAMLGPPIPSQDRKARGNKQKERKGGKSIEAVRGESLKPDKSPPQPMPA
jgi:hypothetical protein